jgi:hypothetical protein
MSNDPERYLHIREVKVRLRPGQMDRLATLARHRDAPIAVVARELLLNELARAEQVETAKPENRRAA